MTRIAVCLIALILAAPALAAPPDPGAPPRTLTVTGTGIAKAAPDEADFSTGVVASAPTAGAALAANSRAMNAVISTLKRQGVPDKAIQTSNLSLNPQYQICKPNAACPQKIAGYQVSNTVSVTVALDKAGAVLDALVASGANQINGISFSIHDPKPLLAEARADAVKDAIEKASLYAKAAGVGLGPSRWQRNPAMKVCVFQRPNGASPGSRSPHKDRPRRRVRLVATAVSSMKTSRAGSRRMRGWRCSIQTRRRSATSRCSRSEAIRAFFICVARQAKHSRERGRADLEAARLLQFRGQFGHGDVRPGFDPGDQKLHVRRQLTLAGRAALRGRSGRAAGLNALQQLHRAAVGNPKMAGRLTPRMTHRHPRHDPFAQIQGIALAHDSPPSMVNHGSQPLGIPNRFLFHA